MSSGLSEHETGLVSSFDETPIAFRVMGEGAGLPLLVVNAVGANMAAWRSVLLPLSAGSRIVMWDQRGTFGSGLPETGRYDAAAQAEDAMAVMDHLGTQDFVIASWSSGGRIALEIAHRYPARVGAVALVSAGYGYPLTRLLKHLELSSLLPMAAGVAKRFAGPLQGALRGLSGRPEIAGVVRQSGLISSSADISALVEVVQGIARTDLKVLLASYEAIVGDPAADILREVTAPVLLVRGDADRFTSKKMVEEMQEALPEATSIVYEGATHFLPVEQPARLAADLERFFLRARDA